MQGLAIYCSAGRLPLGNGSIPLGYGPVRSDTCQQQEYHSKSGQPCRVSQGTGTALCDQKQPEAEETLVLPAKVRITLSPRS